MRDPTLHDKATASTTSTLVLLALHAIPGEEVTGLRHGFELHGVAGRVLEKARPLLAGLPRETHVRLDHELHLVLQPGSGVRGFRFRVRKTRFRVLRFRGKINKIRERVQGKGKTGHRGYGSGRGKHD